MNQRARRVVSSAVAMLVSVTLVGCRASDTAQQKSTTTGTATALPRGTVPEDLTFTGAVSGRLDAARHGNVYTCGGMGSIYIVDPILGSIAGKNYDLGIQITGFKGPGTYKTGGELTPGSGVAAVSVWLKADGTEDASRSKTGTIVVNADRRSGTMDADLTGKLGAFHVSGAWTCPPDF